MGKIIQIKRNVSTYFEQQYLQDRLNQVQESLEKIQRRQTIENLKICIPMSDGFEVITVKTILYCEARGNYTQIFLNDGRKRLLCKTLKWLMAKLPSSLFVRTHNSYLVNKEYILRYFKGDCVLKIIGSEKMIPVSRRRKEIVESLF